MLKKTFFLIFFLLIICILFNFIVYFNLINNFQYKNFTISKFPEISQQRLRKEVIYQEISRKENIKKEEKDEIFLTILILTFKITNNFLFLILSSFLSSSFNSSLNSSLFQDLKIEILIIDNGCQNETFQLINDFQLKLKQQQTKKKIFKITYFEVCENLQYSLAYNKGFQKISKETKWILLLNDDVIPRKNFINNFIYQINILESITNSSASSTSSLNQIPPIGGIACKLLFPNQHIVEAGSVIRFDGGTDNFLRFLFIFFFQIFFFTLSHNISIPSSSFSFLYFDRVASPCNVQSRHVRSIHYGSAACLFVKRNAFSLAGGFDAARYQVT